MPINDRNLTPGTKLVARYHKQTYKAEVVEGEGGKLRLRLADAREYKSPSAAGMAITGKSCNGWAFWSVETATATPETQEANAISEPSSETQEAKDAPTAEHTETPTETIPASEEIAPAKKRIFRLPNQKGVQSGQVRWYCHDCGHYFLAPTGETPQACPQGHKA